MNKFRPQEISKVAVMKQLLKYGRSDNYNFQTRVKWYPAGWGFNKRVLGNIHSRMHYLACHAPEPISKQWRVRYDVFMKKHFGDATKGSMRYLNTWSCHSWL
jgi:hypothetical protein